MSSAMWPIMALSKWPIQSAVSVGLGQRGSESARLSCVVAAPVGLRGSQGVVIEWTSSRCCHYGSSLAEARADCQVNIRPVYGMDLVW